MTWDTPAHQLLWALLIGAETFAVAVLWPLSEWAAERARIGWFVAACALTAACVGLDLRAASAVGPIDALRLFTFQNRPAWIVLPLYLAFPAAVCVASAQSLLHAGVRAPLTRAFALAIAALAVVIAPFAAIAAGCGVAGACF